MSLIHEGAVEHLFAFYKNYQPGQKTHQAPQIPQTVIPRFTDRSDTQPEEGEDLSMIDSFNRERDAISGLQPLTMDGQGFTNGVVVAASSHLPESFWIPRNLLEQAINLAFNRDQSAQLPDTALNRPQKYPTAPAHFCSYTTRETNPDTPLTFFELQSLPKEDRRRFWELEKANIENVINLYRILLNDPEIQHQFEANPDQIDTFITDHLRAFGTVGHYSQADRQTNALSRGAQSGLYYHFNLYLRPDHMFDDHNLRKTPASVDDFLKHITLYDSLLYDYTHQAISTNLQKILQDHSLDTTSISINPTQHHQKNDGVGMPYFESIQIEFAQAIEYHQAMNLVTDVFDQYQGFYQSLQKLHTEYYLTKFLPKQEKTTQRQQLEQTMLTTLKDFSFTDEEAQEALQLLLNFQPTLLQLKTAREANAQHLEPDTIQKIDTHLAKLQKRGQSLQIEAGQVRYLAHLKKAYGLDDFQAQALLRLSQAQLVTDPDDRVHKHNLAPGISGTYGLIIDDLDEITIKGISLAPRLCSEAAYVEASPGVVIQRQESGR